MNVQPYLTWPNILTALAVLLSLGLTAWVWIKYGARIRAYVAEVGAELAKCSWPWNPKEKGLKRYKELIDSTVVVAVSSLLLAGIVTGADFVLLKVIGLLTRLHV